MIWAEYWVSKPSTIGPSVRDPPASASAGLSARARYTVSAPRGKAWRAIASEVNTRVSPANDSGTPEATCCCSSPAAPCITTGEAGWAM